MPGQRKRKRKQDEERGRRVDAYAGWRWHSADWFPDRASPVERVRLLDAHHPLDEGRLRIDTPCTRTDAPAHSHLRVLLPPGLALGAGGTTVVAAPVQEGP
ncbi:hypothetical protein [Kitasatospora sp. NPDC057198]|uniref:hypothetical protein n=1 Tax=Kitasatospora sp. NPDC057198 TaxID=3346046 RepID=UPI00363D0662